MAGDRDQGANGALTEEAKRLRLVNTDQAVLRTQGFGERRRVEA